MTTTAAYDENMTYDNDDYAEYAETHVTSDAPAVLSGASWGAVLAGVVVALLIQTALEMLGLSIGVATINPAAEADPIGPNFDTGVAVWLGVSAMLSLFTGGFVASRLARSSDHVDGILRGLVVLGVTTLITSFLLFSGLSSTLRGVSNLIGEGLSLVGQGVTQIAPEAANAIEAQDTTLSRVLDEVSNLEIQSGTTTALLNDVEQAVTEADPTEELRQEAITTLANQTNLTEEEATNRLETWREQFQEALTTVQNTVERVSSDVADAIAATAGILFLTLVAGAFAAGAGGLVGASENDARLHEHTKTRTVATT